MKNPHFYVSINKVTNSPHSPTTFKKMSQFNICFESPLKLPIVPWLSRKTSFNLLPFLLHHSTLLARMSTTLSSYVCMHKNLVKPVSQKDGCNSQPFVFLKIVRKTIDDTQKCSGRKCERATG